MLKFLLLAILALLAPLEGGGVMLVAHRNGMSVWTNPYVTNGLVAMWDGEWNAGGGVHDANATVWKDLIGNTAQSVSGTLAWTADSCVFDGKQYIDISQFYTGSAITVEFVVSMNSIAQLEAIVDNVNGYTGFSHSVIPQNNLPRSRMYAGIGSSLWASNLQVCDVGERLNAAFAYDSVNHGAYFRAGERVQNGGPSRIFSPNTDGVLRIGRSLSGTGPFNGAVCGMRVYNRRLSDSEIAANYAIDKARFNLP